MINNPTKYRRINRLVKNTSGTFLGLTTKEFSGTVNLVHVSNHYITVKPVNNPAYKPSMKLHKNSILALKGFHGEYNRKFANKNSY